MSGLVRLRYSLKLKRIKNPGTVGNCPGHQKKVKSVMNHNHPLGNSSVTPNSGELSSDSAEHYNEAIRAMADLAHYRNLNAARQQRYRDRLRAAGTTPRKLAAERAAAAATQSQDLPGGTK